MEAFEACGGDSAAAIWRLMRPGYAWLHLLSLPQTVCNFMSPWMMGRLLTFLQDPAEPHLAFIGFARPNVGAIPPISEMQIMWWLEFISGNVSLPVREAVSAQAQRNFAAAAAAAAAAAVAVKRGSEFVSAAQTYSLLSSTSHKAHQYGVDHGAYLHQLARDIGAAPELSWLAWYPRAFMAYIIGQSYTTFFRLQGPFAEAEHLVCS